MTKLLLFVYVFSVTLQKRKHFSWLQVALETKRRCGSELSGQGAFRSRQVRQETVC